MTLNVEYLKDLSWDPHAFYICFILLHFKTFNLNYHFYADDSQLYLSFQPTILGEMDLAVSNIESCVNEINR